MYTCVCVYLSITQPQEVHTQVSFNAIHCSRQCDSTQEQDSEDNIWHCGCDPHHLHTYIMNVMCNINASYLYDA